MKKSRLLVNSKDHIVFKAISNTPGQKMKMYDLFAKMLREYLKNNKITVIEK